MAKKKTTKKTAKKAARKTGKKTAKKATKKAARKTSRKVSKSSSPFPTMEMDDRRDDLYSPPSGGYSSGPSAAMGIEPSEEGSSRRVAILGILVLLVVIVVAVVGREHWAPSKKAGTTTMVDAKKDSKMEPAGTKSAPAVKPAKTADTKSEAGLRYYTVKKGDSLSGIARTMLGSPTRWPEIVKLNKLPNARAAKVGDKLKIPAK